MLIIASLMLGALAPNAADGQPSGTANASQQRCQFHHLPVPPGKGMISTVVRCADRAPTDEAISYQKPADRDPGTKAAPARES